MQKENFMRTKRRALKEAGKTRPANSPSPNAPAPKGHFEDGIKQADLARLENEGGSSSSTSDSPQPVGLETDHNLPVLVP